MRDNPFIRSALAGIVLLLAVQTVIVLNLPSPLQGALADEDSYMRMVRVEETLRTGDWFATHFPRANPPVGETTHWTRPLDFLLIAGAAPLLPFMDTHQALFISAPIIIFLLGVLAVVAFVWASAPFLGEKARAYGGIFFACQAGIVPAYNPAHVDHQALMLIGFTVLIGVFLRMAEGKISDRAACWGGAVGGLFLWVSIEALLQLTLFNLILYVFWIRGRDDIARSLAAFWWGVMGIAAIGVVVENGPRALSFLEYDTLSIVHVLMAALATVFWQIVSRINSKRVVMSGATGIAVLAAMYAVFPKFFAGPYADSDFEGRALFEGHVPEAIPIIGPEGVHWVYLVLILGPFLVSFPIILYRAFKSKEHQASNQMFAVTMTIFSIYTLAMLRGAPYIQIICLIPLLVVLETLLSRSATMVARVGSVFLLAVGITYVPALAISQMKEKGEFTPACNLKPLADVLNAATLGDRPRLILSDSVATQILFRTNHHILSTNRHRSAPQVRVLFKIFDSPTDEAAHRLIETRKIDLILVCPGALNFGAYRGRATDETFYGRVITGEAPDWLRRVKVPKEKSGRYELYEVQR
ncbi:MAG: hypothetical protein HOJ67_08425 [Rhodospirillaceae bacterium]|nr:hypothetical protein [Rhodospirillaceae bacterium]MBT6362212.1 hypothetical protein [Rhodospirillaceae bacterium]MBT7771360.1 hypothetical protein [Rhodospirillales bacterium]